MVCATRNSDVDYAEREELRILDVSLFLEMPCVFLADFAEYSGNRNLENPREFLEKLRETVGMAG